MAGRPPKKLNFKPTEADRELVAFLVHDRLTTAQIAAVFKVTSLTIEHHFRTELDNGHAIAKGELTKWLTKAAKAGNVAAQKHLDMRGLPAAKPEPLGKKEALVREAHVAHENSSWGELINRLN